MSASPLSAGIEALAKNALGERFRLASLQPVSGGDISTSLRARGETDSIFVKCRPASDIAMFRAEAEGLGALANAPDLRVPAVLACAATETHALLLLEWLDIQPLREITAATRAGAALAGLHRIQASRFGAEQDNFIGHTPQINTPEDDWSRFFIRHRLQPQLALAHQNGHGSRLQELGEQVCARLPGLFIDHHPSPSLLHGDLWSGNIGQLQDGSPVLFDPASYHGDREADLAMTELFGGFPLRFYAAYREVWPLTQRYETRKTVYNLYHVLNHLNLFGRGYLAQAERMLSSLLVELKH